jgi:hypothetical protein
MNYRQVYTRGNMKNIQTDKNPTTLSTGDSQVNVVTLIDKLKARAA